MPQIDWSGPAAADLVRIDEWLVENRSADLALKTIRAIRKRAQWLEDFPHGGRPSAGGLRILRVRGTPYLILYRISADAVDVVRVRHEREDWLIQP